MKKEYFVISNSDGDTTIDNMTKDELIEKLGGDGESNYWGAESFIDNLKDSDTNYWGNSILIIKGEMIVPKEKKTVVSYEV